MPARPRPGQPKPRPRSDTPTGPSSPAWSAAGSSSAGSAGSGTAPTSVAGVAPPLFGVLVLAALVISGAGLHAVANIVGPVFLVLTLVITVHPLRQLLVRHKVPQPLASIVAMIVMFLTLIIVLGSVVWSLTRLIQTLTSYASQFTGLYNDALGLLRRFGLSTTVLQDAVSSVNISSFTGLAQTLLSAITSGVSLLALMAAMIFFLALDAAGIGDRIALIRRHRPPVADALTDFADSVRKYWIVTTVFGLIVAAIDVVALLIIGVPLAFTWGVLAFVTNYIPNIGFLIGLVPPTLIAFLHEGGGLGSAIATVACYVAINVVIQTFIQPRFTGDAVGITATVAFLSLIFWSFLLGALGALLAVPATLLVKALLVDHSSGGRWVGALINASPDEIDAARPGIGQALQADGQARG